MPEDSYELKVVGNKIICAAADEVIEPGNLTDSALSASISRLKAFREYEILEMEKTIQHLEDAIKTTIEQLNDLNRQIPRFKKKIKDLKSELNK